MSRGRVERGAPPLRAFYHVCDLIRPAFDTSIGRSAGEASNFTKRSQFLMVV
jgi:hypothetical protein